MTCSFGIDFKKPSEDGWTNDKEKNLYQVETAGFIPLSVKMERFIQQGIIAQFSSSDFDSHDYQDMYLNPDCQILPGDDLEEIQQKLEMQQQIALAAIQKKNLKLGDFDGSVADVKSPSQNSIRTEKAAKTEEE